MKWDKALAGRVTWGRIAVLILLALLCYVMLLYWTLIGAFIRDYGIALATAILAIYAGVSKWWSHQRGLLNEKQKSIHDLHESLEEFNQTFRYLADHMPNDSNGSQRLSSSAGSALTRFLEAYARSRHVIPGYLNRLSETMIELLSTLATSKEHDVEKLKEKLKEVNEPFIKTFNALLNLSAKYEESFKLRNEYGLFRWIFRIKIFDKNMIQCPICQTINSPLSKFCKECGTDLVQVQIRTKWSICPKCPSPNNASHYDEDVYCTICGNLLPKDFEHTLYTGVDGWPVKSDETSREC